MGEEKPIYLIEFVDKRNTSSLIAEAFAKRYLEHYPTFAENLMIVSSGVQVQIIKEIREALKKPRKLSKEKKEEILNFLEPYISLASKRLYSPNLENISNIKSFFRHIGGDAEKEVIRDIVKKESLTDYVELNRVNNPQQKKIKYELFTEDKRKIILGIIFPLDKETDEKIKEIYKKINYDVPISDLIGKIEEIAFITPKVYSKIIRGIEEYAERRIIESKDQLFK